MHLKLIVFFMLLNAGVATCSDKFVIRIKTTNTGLYMLYDAKYQLLDSVRIHSDTVTVQLMHKPTKPGFYFVARDKNNKVYMNYEVFYLAAGDSLLIEETRRGWEYTGNAAALNSYADAYNVRSTAYSNYRYYDAQRATEVLDSVRQVRTRNIKELAAEVAMPAPVQRYHH
jgi:hypothetical protein